MPCRCDFSPSPLNAKSCRQNIEGGVAEEVAAAYGGLKLNVGPAEPFYKDMVKIFRGLHVVDNNSPGRVGGGGVPRRPSAPPICGAESPTRGAWLKAERRAELPTRSAREDVRG